MSPVTMSAEQASTTEASNAELVRDNSAFSINEFFNSLPIRIIGSSTDPFFYAIDLCAILGVTNPYRKVANFDETEILTPARRRELNIETYRIEKSGKKYNDNRIILLTEYGAIRLIISSKSALARPFKEHIYNIIREARLREQQKLVCNTENKLQLANEEIKFYERTFPRLYVFHYELNGKNPYTALAKADRDEDTETFERNEEPVDNVYKFTFKPRKEDWKRADHVADIFGISYSSFIELDHEDPVLEVSQAAFQHTRYIVCDDIPIEFEDYNLIPRIVLPE